MDDHVSPSTVVILDVVFWSTAY